MKFCYFLLFCSVLADNCQAKFYSQHPSHQDEYVYRHYFKNKKNGVFVDIGASDGIIDSNSYFFEKELGWKGLCVEPCPELFSKLHNSRNCTCVQGCVSDFTGESKLLVVEGSGYSGLLHKYEPKHLETIQKAIDTYGFSCRIIDVYCYLLCNLLDENEITHVDYLSIDTEGGEYDILQTIDFSKYTFDVITIEDNYNDVRFIPFFQEKGFKFEKRLAQDLLFVRKDFKKQRKMSLSR